MPSITIGKATVTQTSEREREIVINGVRFFVGLNPSGRRLLSACHESKKVLQSAAAHLEANGYNVRVKSSDEPGLYLLTGQERGTDGKTLWEAPSEEEQSLELGAVRAAMDRQAGAMLPDDSVQVGDEPDEHTAGPISLPPKPE